MEKVLEKANQWADQAVETRCRLKEESYEILTELIKKFGKKKRKKIVVDLSDDPLRVLEFDSIDGEYVNRYITSIELSREQGGIALIYGDDEFEYIRLSDTLLSDRVYIITELTAMFF